MKRRSFLGLLSGALLLPGVAQAQEADAAQVAQRYYAALQAGEVDAAVQLLRPKLVAAAPFAAIRAWEKAKGTTGNE